MLPIIGIIEFQLKLQIHQKGIPFCQHFRIQSQYYFGNSGGSSIIAYQETRECEKWYMNPYVLVDLIHTMNV